MKARHYKAPEVTPTENGWATVRCGPFVERDRWTTSLARVTCRRCRLWAQKAGLLAAGVLALLLVGCTSPAGLEPRNLPSTTEPAGSVLVQRQARHQAAARATTPRRSILAAQIADHLAARWTGNRNTHEREHEARCGPRRARRGDRCRDRR